MSSREVDERHPAFADLLHDLVSALERLADEVRVREADVCAPRDARRAVGRHAAVSCPAPRCPSAPRSAQPGPTSRVPSRVQNRASSGYVVPQVGQRFIR